MFHEYSAKKQFSFFGLNIIWLFFLRKGHLIIWSVEKRQKEEKTGDEKSSQKPYWTFRRHGLFWSYTCLSNSFVFLSGHSCCSLFFLLLPFFVCVCFNTIRQRTVALLLLGHKLRKMAPRDWQQRETKSGHLIKNRQHSTQNSQTSYWVNNKLRTRKKNTAQTYVFLKRNVLSADAAPHTDNSTMYAQEIREC